MPSEFLMSFQRFSQMVPLGDPDHVLLGVLKALNGTDKRTATDWKSLMKSLKAQPATSGVKRIG